MTPYERIAVVTDALVVDDAAVAVSSALARTVGALELIAVSADRTAAAITRARLERIAAHHGWPPAACTVLVGRDRTTTLRRHLSRRHRTVAVLALNGRISDLTVASLLDDVVATTGRPVLVVGPDIDHAAAPLSGALVVFVDDTPADPATIRAVTTWATTFGLAIMLRGAGDETGTAHDASRAWHDALVREHITVVDPTRAGDDAAGGGPSNAVVVVSCDPTAGSDVLLGIAELLRRAHHPVLLVARTATARVDPRAGTMVPGLTAAASGGWSTAT